MGQKTHVLITTVPMIITKYNWPQIDTIYVIFDIHRLDENIWLISVIPKVK